MALGLGSLISGGLGLIGGLAGSNAQNQGYSDALNKLTSTYNNSLGNYSSYLNLGNQANSGLSSLLSGDYSGFYNSPDYQSALASGAQALDRSAASKGSLYSGGQSADLTAYGQNLANQYLNSYRNSLTSLSNTGLNAANGVSQLGTSYSGNYANVATGKGNAQANAYDGLSNTLGNFTSALGKVTGWF